MDSKVTPMNDIENFDNLKNNAIQIQKISNQPRNH